MSSRVKALLFFAILGLLLGFCARNYGETRTYRVLVTTIIPGLYFPPVEIGQMFVRSRGFDINDILAGWLGTFGGIWNLHDLLTTISYGIPLGFLWSLRQYRRSGHSTPAGSIVIPFLLGVLFEGAQHFSPSRSADLTDVLSYGLGGYIGLWLFQRYGTGIFLIQPYRPRRTYGIT